MFIWVGGGVHTNYGASLQRSKTGYRVRFVGNHDNTQSWLAAAKLVLVTSIEESSSLVALEAADTGTPVMAFQGTGGIDEFLADGAGFLVVERSATAMAISVMNFLGRSTEENNTVGLSAARKVRAECDYETQCEAIAGVLESVPLNLVV
jgi:glycosyltransferase involved in cell wall biosynthesis